MKNLQQEGGAEGGHKSNEKDVVDSNKKIHRESNSYVTVDPLLRSFAVTRNSLVAPVNGTSFF